MATLQIVNLIANILITVGVSLFMVFVYGRSGMIDKLPYFEKMFIKVALAGTACGAFFNVLTAPTPQFAEIVFNCGLALVFLWASWFHFKYFVKNKK
jgi:hypothetical protein